ncbi:hypothetical protein HFO93_07150 [Rhizobium leguminosarum]|uniref:hypothetical protein n=1 Tax=Rhizobium leguminosarum TaxID=384 RepID=UPI0003AA8C21|nr:hypothetical protein [Rhizobium leguminosarum]MBY5443255.1 hypothetical protein [Rhizobium leguminosarum]
MIETIDTKDMSKIWTSLGKFKSGGMRRRPASLSGSGNDENAGTWFRQRKSCSISEKRKTMTA